MKGNLKSDIIKIFFANLLAHGWLLILTGTFWDDWLYYYHDKTVLWKQFMEAGRPSAAIWIELVWKLPNFGYRKLIFFLFFFASVLFFIILRNISWFEQKEALYLGIMFAILPVNDCRVLLCTVVYTVGYISFLIGCSLLLYWIKHQRESWFLRIIILFFFGYSFILNSILVYYGIILMALLYVEYTRRGRIFSAIRSLYKYLDFILLPIVFFMGKQILFPTYGRYTEYNVVSLSSVLTTLKNILPLTFYQLIAEWKTIFESVLPHGFVNSCTLCLCLGGVVLLYWRLIKIGSIGIFWRYENRYFYIQKLGLGGLLFMLGLFPYIVIRGGIVGTVGTPSRDTILLAPGIVLILYSIVKLVLEDKFISRGLFCIFCLFCVITCNLHYMAYQMDEYWQEALIHELGTNEGIREAENILFLTRPAYNSGSAAITFYSLNGNASVAYGDESRFFMNGYIDLNRYLKDKKNKSIWVDSGGYGMNDYDPSNDQLDGIAVFNCKIGYKECIRLKLLEISNPTEYWENINQVGKLYYYLADSPEAMELLEGYVY